MNEVKANTKEKEITEKVWFKRLSTIGIIIFSLGIPSYALIVRLTLSELWNKQYTGLIVLAFLTPSIVSSLILFFIILFIFYRLPPMGKKIALPLIWIAGLPGFIAFVLWSVILFVAWFVVWFM